MASFPLNQSAFGANPSTLYFTPRIGPYGNGDLLANHTSLPSDLGFIGMLYSLASREAIVSVICVPSPKVAKFFTVESYILSRLSWPLRDLVPGPGASISRTK